MINFTKYPMNPNEKCYTICSASGRLPKLRYTPYQAESDAAFNYIDSDKDGAITRKDFSLLFQLSIETHVKNMAPSAILSIRYAVEIFRMISEEKLYITFDNLIKFINSINKLLNISIVTL